MQDRGENQNRTLIQNSGDSQSEKEVEVCANEQKSADTEGGEVLDIAVIGAGPAGLTAGLYAARAGMKVAVFERISAGGQLAQTEQLENYPGFPQGTEGFQLAMDMKAQADRFGVRTLSEEVTALDVQAEPKQLSTPFGSYAARAVIVATGARPRKLGVAGEKELTGKGVSYCATCDGNFFRNKRVAVVGGGNTAVADALYLARVCEKVYLIHRRDSLRATAIYHERLAQLPNVEFIWNTLVEGLEANETGTLASLILRNVKNDEQQNLAVSGVFVAVGTQPNTEFLQGALELDEAGYIIADETGATSCAGVWAAGDVRTKVLRQVVTAVSDGAICAEQAAEALSL